MILKCIICGLPFENKNPAIQCCGKACAQKLRLETRLANPTIKKCLICGTDFPAFKSDMVCCSTICRRTKRRELKRKWNLENPVEMEAIQRKNKLRERGLTTEDYELLLAKQKGQCAICGKSEDQCGRGRKYLCIDHDHKTGIVRGLLCGSCNMGLGMFSDRDDLLMCAAEYIRENNQIQNDQPAEISEEVILKYRS